MVPQEVGSSRTAHLRARLAHWTVPIAPERMAAFHTYVGQQHGPFLLTINVLAILAYYSYLLADALLIPDQFDASLLVRSFLAIFGLLNIYLVFRYLRMPQWMDRLMPIHDIFATFAWFELLKRSDSPDVTHFLYASIIFIVLCNLGIRGSFTHALICSLAISAGILLNVHWLVTPHELLVFTLVYLPMLAFSLFISWTNTRSVRRAFLVEEQSQQQRCELSRLNARLLHLAATDALTGIANRRAFDRDLDEYWQAMQRNGRGFALLMVDIDFFKLFNDHYGHPAGDRCLAEVAGGMQTVLREGQARIYRYGGEEFAILLQVEHNDELQNIAERLISEVAKLGIEHRHREHGPKYVTISVGATLASPERDGDGSSLVDACDRMLYQAKHRGRNRVEVEQREQPA